MMSEHYQNGHLRRARLRKGPPSGNTCGEKLTSAAKGYIERQSLEPLKRARLTEVPHSLAAVVKELHEFFSTVLAHV